MSSYRLFRSLPCVTYRWGWAWGEGEGRTVFAKPCRRDILVDKVGPYVQQTAQSSINRSPEVPEIGAEELGWVEGLVVVQAFPFAPLRDLQVGVGVG